MGRSRVGRTLGCATEPLVVPNMGVGSRCAELSMPRSEVFGGGWVVHETAAASQKAHTSVACVERVPGKVPVQQGGDRRIDRSCRREQG